MLFGGSYKYIGNWWLLKEGREDITEEILTETEVQTVKREWEWHEMWYDLSQQQKRHGHLPSIYNAALNSRSGWVAVANAIIKYRMPQIPTLQDHECATQQINVVGTFATALVTWLSIFAQTMVEYWETSKYKKARTQSNTAVETWGSRYQSRWRGDLLNRQHGLTPQQEQLSRERVVARRKFFAAQERNQRLEIASRRDASEHAL